MGINSLPARALDAHAFRRPGIALTNFHAGNLGYWTGVSPFIVQPSMDH